MSELTKLPNIGKELARQLEMIGITTTEELLSIGSENTFIKLKILDPLACQNRLYAIEGAVQGIRWHYLSKQRKQELQEFFRMCNKD